MYLEFRHDVKGVYGWIQAEERTFFVDVDTIKIGLRELRKDKNSVLWLYDIRTDTIQNGECIDLDATTSMMLYWDTWADYDNRVCTIRYILGDMLSYREERVPWAKARKKLLEYA